MKLRISRSLTYNDGAKMPTRTVNYDVIHHGKLPRCAWCRMPTLTPVFDTEHVGFTIKLLQTACYCALCEKGTIVEYEIPLEGES